MRKASAFLPLILALLPAIMCSGEDRVELIKGANGSRELVYRNDALAEERSYDAGGGLLGEKSFGSDSLPTGTTSYIREEGRLVRVEARDASGVIVGTQAYHYDRDGMLLGVTADGSLGDGATGMVSSGGTPHNSWTEAGSATTVLGYDESGRVAVIQTTRDGKSISLERRTYGEGGILSSVVTEDSASGSSSELLYDENGRQSQRRDILAKGPEAKTLYRYDESGHLLEETRRVGMHTTSIKKVYADDGTLSRTETRLDGELLLAVENIENGRVEVLYDDGAIFVKATYIGGRKVKDDFFSEGVLLRSRDYQ